MLGRYAFRFEPTIWFAVLRAAVYAAAQMWGPELDNAQKISLVTFFEALVAAFNRSLVSPVDTATSSVTVTTTDTAPRNPEDSPR